MGPKDEKYFQPVMDRKHIIPNITNTIANLKMWAIIPIGYFRQMLASCLKMVSMSWCFRAWGTELSKLHEFSAVSKVQTQFNLKQFSVTVN